MVYLEALPTSEVPKKVKLGCCHKFEHSRLRSNRLVAVTALAVVTTLA
jgi:hypothetical protein